MTGGMPQNAAALTCTATQRITLHCSALQCTALHCTALHCTALQRNALHFGAHHTTTLYFTTVHCTKHGKRQFFTQTRFEPKLFYSNSALTATKVNLQQNSVKYICICICSISKIRMAHIYRGNNYEINFFF